MRWSKWVDHIALMLSPNVSHSIDNIDNGTTERVKQPGMVSEKPSEKLAQ